MVPHQILYGTIGFFLLISVPFTECEKVHELMTDDEIMHVFQTSRDKVPEYEMVVIEHSLRKRSIRRNLKIKLKAFDNDIEAYLDPIDGILGGEDTPVWVAHTHRGKTHYQKLKQGIMKEVFGIYQGVSDEAALVVKTRSRQDFQFHGTIQDLTVIPLPKRVELELQKTEIRKRDLSRIGHRMPITPGHIVFKLNRTVDQVAATPQLNESMVESSEDTFKQNDTSKSEHSTKYMVFPTILVTTDFDIAVDPSDENAYYDQIIYQLAFWNGVDLRYRQLNNPKVRLRIAGIVIGFNRSATPYLKRNTDNGKINGYLAIDEMQDYWAQMRWDSQFSPGGVHIVATVTNLKLFAIEARHLKYQLDGLASGLMICDQDQNQTYPSILFRDNLGFDGINGAVHELAHLLGADHDDQDECPSSDGYLMADSTSKTVKNLKWSNCSLKMIERTLRTRDCIDKPDEHYPSGKPLERVWPGALKTIDEQCQARGFDWACETTPGICRILRCYYSGLYGFFMTALRCRDSWSAAEGTECAPKKYCIHGECVPFHREIKNNGTSFFLL